MSRDDVRPLLDVLQDELKYKLDYGMWDNWRNFVPHDISYSKAFVIGGPFTWAEGHRHQMIIGSLNRAIRKHILAT